MITAAFLQWWLTNAPKGAVRSPHALFVVMLLRDAKQGLTVRQIHAKLITINLKSINNFVRSLTDAGLLVTRSIEFVCEETVRHRGKLITFQRRRACRLLCLADAMNRIFTTLAPQP